MSNIVSQFTHELAKSFSREHEVFLKAENLYKIYKKGAEEIRALNNINLDIEKGEVIALVGPSGSGKSTLLHILGGLDRPTAGSVLLDGADIYKIRENERARVRNEKIGFVFQFYHLLPEFTVLENTLLPAMMKRRPPYAVRCTTKATELLNRVGLKNRINHKPGELSGGEAQRAAIARALMNDPDIVLCDEPTGNLDSGTSEEIHGLISELNADKKTTFIIATHEPALAEKASRVVRIKDGRLEQ